MEELSEHDRWLSLTEAAKYLDVSKGTLYAYMKDGRLPFYYIKGSNQRRIKKSDIDSLLVPGKPDDLSPDDDGDDQ